LRHAISQAADAVGLAGAEISILLADDDTIRLLNRTWRGKDMPTNVLAFPIRDSRNPEISSLLGDIVIAYETAEHEARMQRKSLVQHLLHLAVHGFLHLAGYDHQHDEQAQAMERLERLILAELDVPDPYATRDEAAA
jgi:probable rRNA maturation factor